MDTSPDVFSDTLTTDRMFSKHQKGSSSHGKTIGLVVVVHQMKTNAATFTVRYEKKIFLLTRK
jgi:hypothetical protein